MERREDGGLMIPKYKVWNKVKEEMINDYDLAITSDGSVLAGDLNYDVESGMLADVTDSVEIIMSTGLKDKNNIEIYEGDIVEFKYPYDKRVKTKGIIVRNNNKACFGINMKETTEQYELYRITAENYLTVIGNIHENLDLLEDE
ncbi:YopX family protein [Staphylococcus pseudintermedius]|uniref:YopX family protein n=1 Tax=Staphylococcus pseudintermedius TaxID=283734 RepID=UPI00223BF3A0|nr:YopX family protein [Staphylococcus pseudintermedius]